MSEALKVSVAGVRGVVGRSMTPQIALSFAQAFGTFVGRGAVVVGRDTRPSGAALEHAVVAGLQSVGCKPVLVGIVPTPTLLMNVQDLGANGGIAITASHNPAEWNALKFVGRDGLFLDEARAQEFFDLYHQQDFPLVGEQELQPVVRDAQGPARHFARVLRYVDVAAIRAARFKVAVDCCNGVGALYSANFLREQLGCEVVTVFDQPTGLFEREPEPVPQQLGRLGQAVVQHGCALGFAQDPDGDRLAIVNERGEPIGEDLTLALAVWQVLERHGRGSVAINQSTSKCVEDVARTRGCEVYRTKIGEINVASTMLRRNCVVGGENNGGVMISAIHPCRDSFAGMAVILELMAKEQRSLSALRADIPAYVVARDKLSIRSDRAPAILRAMRRDYAGRPMDFLDGAFIDFGDAWAHIRRSNTEPVIRVTVEARTEEAARNLLDEVRAKVIAASR